ncbi:hypothetical protein TNCV_897751 [Trichonephila clavipes]|nr:hypothetical protein TNCV_897751 [Trichonephila clavipes]
MALHKRNSNNSELLDIEYSISKKHLFDQLEECTTKTLGIVWNPKIVFLSFAFTVGQQSCDFIETEHYQEIVIFRLYYSYSGTNSSPHQLKTFVANRVSKIQVLSANYQWKHISSRDNPADLISRGVNPSDLEHLELWVVRTIFCHGKYYL